MLFPRRPAYRLVLSALFPAVLLGFTGAAQDKAAAPAVVGRLKGHGETVYSVAYSPDGKYLVTGSFDHTLKLWEVATGKEVKTYSGPTGHQKMVLSVAFSPDGQMIASGSADNTLKVWDVPVGTPIRSLKTPEVSAAVALSPDGVKLAVGGRDGSLKLVNAADFKELLKFNGHTGAVNGIAFSANGQVLASAGADRMVRFWNTANGQLIAAVGAHTGAVNGVTFNPGGPAYSVGDDGLLKVWQVPTAPARTLPGHTAAIHVLALSNDGNTVITGGEDKSVRQFLTAAGKEVRALTGPQSAVRGVALHPGGTLIAAGSDDRHAYLWSAADGKPAGQVLAHDGAVTDVQFHPQGTQLATAGADGLVRFWALPFAPLRAIAHPDGVLVAVASADNRKLYTGGADKIVRVWDVAKLTIERQLAGHTGAVTALAVSANGQVLVSGGADATLRFWNQATGKEAEVIIAHGAPITSLALNPAGNQLVSTSEDGTVKLWQVPAVPAKVFVHPDQVTSLTLATDGAKLLTGAGDKVARLWNLAAGVKERDYSGGPTLPITAVALSPNGTTVAAASLDKTLTLWNAADGKVRHRLPLPAVIQAVAFAPDSLSLAAGLADGTVRVIQVADGKERKSLAGHKGAVTAVAFGPKADVLYSAGADQAVQVWSLPDGAAKTKLVHDAAVTGMALGRDGTRLVAVGARSVKVWNVADAKPIAAWMVPADVRGVALAPDQSRVVVAGADKLARVYEIDGRLVEAFAHDGLVQAVALIDGKRVVTVADKVARLWTSSLLWQKAHQGACRRGLFSAKGDQVISAGDDKAIRIWNAADGKEIKTLANPEGPVTQVALSVDGTRLASAGRENAVKVWTLADAKVMATLGIAGPPTALALSPNGQRLAVATADEKEAPIRVYDIALARAVQTFAAHAAPVKSVAFLGDNRTLLTASLDRSARLLDVAALSALVAHPPGPVHMQLHAGGTQLLTAGADKTVKLWDLAKAVVIRTFGPLPGPAQAIAFSKDYTQVAAAAGKLVKVWNVADGKESASLIHAADVLSVAFSPDKTRLATGAADKQTRLWELATGRELQFFSQPDAVEAVAYTSAGAVVSSAGKVVAVEVPSIVRAIAADAGPVYSVAMAPNNTHVLTGGTDKAVKMWNLNTGANDRTFPGATAPVKAIAPAKNGVLVAAAGGDQVRVYQFADAKEMGTVKAGGPVAGLAFSPNSQVLVGAAADRTLLAWGVLFTPGQPVPAEFLKPLQSFGAAEPIRELVFAADNATIFTAGLDKAVHAWKLASPVPTRNFPHPNNVDAVAFQPKGTLLASGGHDGKVRLFDLTKNAQVKEITAHVDKTGPNTIYTVAFSADGKRLVTSSFDNSLKLWDVPGGNLLREFKAHKVKEFEKGHADPVYAAALSPDGKWLASGSGGLERVIKIWNVADGSVVRDLANPQIKTPPQQPPSSHPGDVLRLEFTRDGKLISLGDAPKNKGFLAVWDPQSGTMLFGETLPMGSFFGMALSPDESTVAIAAGNRGKANPEFNSVYLLKLPTPPK